VTGFRRILATSLKRLGRSLRVIFGSTRLRVGIPILFILLPLIFGVGANLIFESMSTSQRSAEMKEFIEDLRMQMTGLVIASSILGLMLGLGVVYVMLKPIEHIQRTAEELARGQFTGRIEFDRPTNEIGQMGRSFNTMIDTLHRMFAERNAYMMEQLSGAVMTLALDGSVISANNLACEILSLSDPELVGAKLPAILAKQPANAPLVVALDSCLRGGQSLFSRQSLLADSRGELLTVVVSTTQLHDASGGLYSIVVNIQNLDRMREFYRSVNRTDRLAAIGTFAMGMAHEIRNPLGSIKGLTQLMIRDSPASGRAQSYGEVILSEVNRLDKLLSELLAFSQPAGASLEHVDVRETAKHAAEMAELKISEATEGASLKVPLTLDMPVTIQLLAPRDKLFQAIFNIVLNAFEAARDGGGEVTLTMREDPSGKTVRLTICNTCSRIDESDRDKIFEPFFTTKEGGTGLGLAIAYQILTYAGANIQLRTADNTVCFDIDFPSGPDGPVA